MAQTLTPNEFNPHAAGVQQNLEYPVGFKPEDCDTPASNTAAVVTMPADADRPNVLRQIWCSYSATPTGGSVQVEDGSGTVVWKQLLAGAGPYELLFSPPKQGTKNTALIVTLAAGGSGVSGTLAVNGYQYK